MIRWLGQARTALAYWRGFETVSRIVLAGIAVVGGGAVALV
jgi:hypothetical protein